MLSIDLCINSELDLSHRKEAVCPFKYHSVNVILGKIAVYCGNHTKYLCTCGGRDVEF